MICHPCNCFGVASVQSRKAVPIVVGARYTCSDHQTGMPSGSILIDVVTEAAFCRSSR